MNFGVFLAVLALSGMMSADFAQAGEINAAKTTSSAQARQILFQVNNSDPSGWIALLDNVNKVQQAAGDVPLTVEIVVYGQGIYMMKADSVVAARVQQVIKAGAEVKICENTMRSKHLSHKDMQLNLSYVPSGVVEVLDKQRKGYVYSQP